MGFFGGIIIFVGIRWFDRESKLWNNKE